VRLVDNGFPVPAPLEPKVHAKDAHDLVLQGFRQIFVALEHADIEGNAKVVVRVTAPGAGDFGPRLGAALGVERILLGIGSQAADHFDPNAAEGRFLNIGFWSSVCGRSL
jgi:hypothetical protein